MDVEHTLKSPLSHKKRISITTSSPVLSTLGPAGWTFQQSPDPSRSPEHTSTHRQVLLIIPKLVAQDFVHYITKDREKNKSSDVWFTWADVELRAWPIWPLVNFFSSWISFFPQRCFVFFSFCAFSPSTRFPLLCFSSSILLYLLVLLSPYALSDLTCSTESGQFFHLCSL